MAHVPSAPLVAAAPALDAPPAADEAMGGDAAPHAAEAAGPEATAGADGQPAGAARRNTSKYHGVYINASGRVISNIMKNGTYTYLGTCLLYTSPSPRD